MRVCPSDRGNTDMTARLWPIPCSKPRGNAILHLQTWLDGYVAYHESAVTDDDVSVRRLFLEEDKRE